MVLFFGAGASIPAGMNGVVGLVDEYKKDVKSKSETDFKIIDKITAKLADWIRDQNQNRHVDIFPESPVAI
jgi:hypothetical protein